MLVARARDTKRGEYRDKDKNYGFHNVCKYRDNSLTASPGVIKEENPRLCDR